MTIEPSKLLDWRGQTAVVLASGPSLTLEQIAAVERSSAKSIAVNTTWEKALFATVFYACDFLYLREYREEMKRAVKGRIWTQDRTAAENYQLHWVRQTTRDGLGRGVVNVSGNSGAGALNLAHLFGARRILLLGMDMRLGPKGEKHHHPDHPKTLVQVQLFKEWIHKMRPMAKDLAADGCEVINCTPGSAIPYFPFSTIEKELA